jgi:hypothetical protein
LETPAGKENVYMALKKATSSLVCKLPELIRSGIKILISLKPVGRGELN